MDDIFTPEQIAQILEEFFKVVGTRRYVGERYVPIFGRKGEESIQWDNSAPYEPLTIVLYQGNSYTSRQFVPIGVDITNQEFWALTGNYNALIELYHNESISAFDTVADMQAATNLLAGMTCHTNGLHASGDGGAAYYKIGTSGDIALYGGLRASKVNISLSNEAIDEITNGDVPSSAGFVDETGLTRFWSNIKTYVGLSNQSISYDVVTLGEDCDTVVISIPKSNYRSFIDVTMETIEQESSGRVSNAETVLDYALKRKPLIVSNICSSTCMRFEGSFYGTDAPITIGTTGIFGQKTADSDVTVENPTANGTMADLSNWYTCNIQWPVVVKDGNIISPSVGTYSTTNPLPCYGYNDDYYFLMYPFGRSLKSSGVYWRDIATYAVSIGIEDLIIMDGGGSMFCSVLGGTITPNLNTDNEYRKNPMCLVFESTESDGPSIGDLTALESLSRACEQVKRLNYMYHVYNAITPQNFGNVSAHTIETNPSNFAYIDLYQNGTLDHIQEGNYGVIEPISSSSYGFKLNKTLNNGSIQVSGEYRLTSGVTPPSSIGIQIVRRLYENNVQVGSDAVIGRVIFTPVTTAQQRQAFALVANMGACVPIKTYDQNGNVTLERHWEFWVRVPNYLEFRDVVMTIDGINYHV